MGYYLAAPCHQRPLQCRGELGGVYLANPRQVWHENPCEAQCVVNTFEQSSGAGGSECAQTISGGDQEPRLASSYAQEFGRTLGHDARVGLFT